jgi:hypothetical protein
MNLTGKMNEYGREKAEPSLEYRKTTAHTSESLVKGSRPMNVSTCFLFGLYILYGRRT